MNNDITLVGVCLRHPRSGVEVIYSENFFYYLDESSINNWVENECVTFIAEKSHAFEVKKK